MSTKALERHLMPLLPFLTKDGVTEICINQPKEIFVEVKGKFTLCKVPELEYELIEALAALVAEFNDQEFPSPSFSGSLLNGERVQFVMSPGCERRKIVCSIRRQQVKDLSLEDYEAIGSFDELKVFDQSSPHDALLKKLYQERNFLGFVKHAIIAKKNMLISGGTGTGKTTFLNACLKAIPSGERILTLEDTREVRVTQPNVGHLLFNEEDKRITALNMFKACLRLHPDRIFLSELRGAEAWPYLRAINSGHPGSLSTVHADTPEGAFKQLTLMLQASGSINEKYINDYVRSIIPIVVQLKRDADPKRFVTVSEVYYSYE